MHVDVFSLYPTSTTVVFLRLLTAFAELLIVETLQKAGKRDDEAFLEYDDFRQL